MSLSYRPDPSIWTVVPPNPLADWASSAAEALAKAQGADEPEVVSQLSALLTAAAADATGDEDDRWVCTTNVRRGGIVLDLDILDLGADAPDDVVLDADTPSGQLEEFSAGATRGKRIVWVTTPVGDEPSDNDGLQGQVLYVARVANSSYLVTMRSGQHQLDLIVESVAACEDMLATMTSEPT